MTYSSFKKTYKPSVIKFLADQNIKNIAFNENAFKNINFSTVKLDTLEALSQMLFGVEMNKADFVKLIYHVSANKESNNRFTKPMLTDMESIKSFSVN